MRYPWLETDCQRTQNVRQSEAQPQAGPQFLCRSLRPLSLGNESVPKLWIVEHHAELGADV
jgi:hypothetical protein